jgi:hypothetical protein
LRKLLRSSVASLTGSAIEGSSFSGAHHIPSSMIGIGVGLFALLPRVGILDIEDMKRLNYLPVIFGADAVSMGTVLEQPRASTSSPAPCSCGWRPA